jgi:SAM-dependent methyltransferase
MKESAAGDSKALWEEVHRQIPQTQIALGAASSAAYIRDPKMLAFMAARYKFVGKMLHGCRTALEVGCGDGFGAPLVAQSVEQVICTDIHEGTLADNRIRLAPFANVDFRYFDFRSGRFPDTVDAVYAVDVIEHVFPAEEPLFLTNIVASLGEHGIGILGTPNVTAEKYASEYSRLGHVNLKDHQGLRGRLSEYFHNVFIFSMNDEIVHTGYFPMAHYLWALCVTPKRS